MEVRTKQRGFSVVEVLIASAIFLIIAVGVLPLFTQAIKNNLAGQDATDVSNLGKSKLEELLQVPFDALVVPAGQTVGETKEYYSVKDKVWRTGVPPSTDPALWLRNVKISQYSLADLRDNGALNTPLVGGTSNTQVHLREIIVEVQGTRGGGALGVGKKLTLRMLRSV